MKSRTAGLCLAAAMLVGSFGVEAALPGGPAAAHAAEQPKSADWMSAIAAAAERHRSLDRYRTAIQQRATDVVAASAESREQLLGGNKPDGGVTLSSELDRRIRLAAASQQLYGARTDLELATRSLEVQAAFELSNYVVADRSAAVYRELEQQLAETAANEAVRERYGLRPQENPASLEEARAAARANALDAQARLDESAGTLESAHGLEPTAFRAEELFRDYRIDTLDERALVAAGLEADPALRKLESAYRLEKRKFDDTLALYRDFYGAEALSALDGTLQLRPVDYTLTLSVYNALLAELRSGDAARSPMEGEGVPARLAYLGEERYALPQALLAVASSAALVREQARARADQTGARYKAARTAEKTMRGAVAAEAEALATVRAAETKRRMGVGQGGELSAARIDYALARASTLQAYNTYFDAVMDLHYATGGVMAARLAGDATAPLGEVAPNGELQTSIAEAEAPLVAYDPSMERELADAAERLERQIQAAGGPEGADGQPGEPDSGGEPAEKPEGADGQPGEPESGGEPAEEPEGVGEQPSEPESGGEPAEKPEGVGEQPSEPGRDESGAPSLAALAEFDALSEALKLADAAGAADVAAELERKLAARTEAVVLALGLPASADLSALGEAPRSQAERDAQAQALAVLLPYMEQELFPAIEAELMEAWRADAAGAYTDAELAALAAADEWETPDGLPAVPLSPDSVAFADRPIRLDAPPMRIGGDVYVPIRPYAEALGFLVEWQADALSSVLTGDDGRTDIRVGTPTVIRNGASSELPAASYLIRGQTFVPLEYFSNVLGMRIYWSGSIQQGVIFSPPERADTE